MDDQLIREFLSGCERNAVAYVGNLGPLGGQHYRGSRITRLTRSWLPHHRSGDAAISEGWNLLTARTRDLAENDPVIKRARKALTDFVIGDGLAIHADARAPGDRGQFYDDWNDESDDEFRQWCDEEADAEGKLTFGELQRQAFAEGVSPGNGLLVKCLLRGGGRRHPLAWQLIEWEQLDRTKDRPASAAAQGEAQNRIVGGIELDAAGRAVAYHVLDAHPYDYYGYGTPLGTSTRVPAERVLHWFVPPRPSAHCGISWFNAIMQSARDLDWYVGNEMTSAAIAAMLAIVVKREHQGSLGLSDDTDESDAQGNPLVKLGAGLISQIGPQDSVEAVESARPNRDAEPFIKLLLHLQAMGVDLSYYRLTGDYRQSSFTTARAAHLDDEAAFRPLRTAFGARLVRKVRTLHDNLAAGLGLYESVTPTEFRREGRRLQRYAIIGGGREQLGPKDETESSLARLRGGTSTLQKECGLRGLHWREVLRQKRRELDYLRKLGLELDFSKAAQSDSTNVDGDSEADDSETGGEPAAPPASKPKRQRGK